MSERRERKRVNDSFRQKERECGCVCEREREKEREIVSSKRDVPKSKLKTREMLTS